MNGTLVPIAIKRPPWCTTVTDFGRGANPQGAAEISADLCLPPHQAASLPLLLNGGASIH